MPRMRTCESCGRPFTPTKSKIGRERCESCRPETPTRRTPISRAQRARLLNPNSKCRYCGEPAVTLDHAKPAARGGQSTDDNLVPCCEDCNSRKGARPNRAECDFDCERHGGPHACMCPAASTPTQPAFSLPRIA